jgi:predicted nucleotidyltransferase component of viral defense system
MSKPTKDIATTVRARLLELSKERKEDHQLLLVRYANERLLHRLSVSQHAGQFVLKGAALFTLWTGRAHRATRDLDLLGFGDPDEERIRVIFVEILRVSDDNDAVVFDTTSLSVETIREGQEYGGVRVELEARIAKAKLRLQIDVGFGDAITPNAELVEFPALLDFPAPRLRAYPKETVVAEKVEAMVKLGMANSRMKDFFDVMVLAQMYTFDGQLLVRAFRATFEHRGTPLPSALPVAWTDAFTTDALKQTQWGAFLRKSGAREIQDNLGQVVRIVAEFAAGPLLAAADARVFRESWDPGGPWTPKG